MAMMWERVEKHAHEVQIVTGDVGYLEDGAYSARDKLSSSLDALFSVLDEDGYFSCARRFEDFGQLSDGLLEDLRRADVNFGNDNHDWDIECEGDTQMLSVLVSGCSTMHDGFNLLAHANKAIIGSNHQQAVVGLAGQQTEDGCAQVPFVAC